MTLSVFFSSSTKVSVAQITKIIIWCGFNQSEESTIIWNYCRCQLRYANLFKYFQETCQTNSFCHFLQAVWVIIPLPSLPYQIVSVQQIDSEFFPKDALVPKTGLCLLKLNPNRSKLIPNSPNDTTTMLQEAKLNKFWMYKWR